MYLSPFFVALLLMAHAAIAADPAPPEPRKVELSLVAIFESDKPEYVFVIGQAGFKSVETLESYLGTLPAGSEVTWNPGCIRNGGEPLLSSDEAMKSFREFLEKRGIKFVLVPSG